MSEISTNIIKEAIYKLCFDSNTCLQKSIYSKILQSYENTNESETKNLLKNILLNAKIAYETSKPLCQDTGQVIVFLEIGQNIKLTGEYIETAINSAVEKCYKDNFFRKSTVKNAIFDRTNTRTNTPVIIYTKIIAEDEIRIKVLIKGAGSENKSQLSMLLPTTSKEEFIKKISELILKSEENACPPMFIGIGSGFTADKAILMSKEALLCENFTQEETELAQEIKEYINSNAPEKYKNCYVLDVKLLTDSTHIACMPVGITINCHSDRYSSCTIKNNEIIYHHKKPDFIDINEEISTKKEVIVDDIETLKKLKTGEEFLLTGEIYVARDAAHKRIDNLLKTNLPLPIQIENKIIFYAGPTPAKPNEISGSIGPTTAGRMDSYAAVLYKKGLLATIGKGSRSKEITDIIKEKNAKYFTVQGGIAALLSEKIKESKIIAFEDLGAEAIYKIYIDKLPLKVEIA